MDFKEIWKDINGFEGIYQVSNLGRVKSLKRKIGTQGKVIEINREKIMKGRIDLVGYLKVVLRKDGYGYEKQIHRLVLEAFKPETNNSLVVNHIDGVKNNNNLDNLEWCTQKENLKHASKMGLLKNRNTRKYKVIKCDKDNNVIKIYNNLSEASKGDIGLKLRISRCCRGIQQSADGFIWKRCDI